MVKSTMTSEHPNKRSTPAEESSQALSIPRWVVIAVALIVLVPVLLMSSMMLLMGLFGPPMHGGMAASDPGRFAVVGVVPLLLVLGVSYGAYRLWTADRE